ncbi:MAG: hypothetical protein ABEI52_10800, partial [Halobacteriaceae archaeon]
LQNVIEAKHDSINTVLDQLPPDVSIRPDKWESSGRTENVREQVADAQRILADILSPSEVLSTMVSSLYILYDGPTRPYRINLEEEDLTFLRRFRWNDAPMFHNGLVRYEAMQTLQRRGISHEAAKDSVTSPVFYIDGSVHRPRRLPVQPDLTVHQ